MKGFLKSEQARQPWGPRACSDVAHCPHPGKPPGGRVHRPPERNLFLVREPDGALDEVSFAHDFLRPDEAAAEADLGDLAFDIDPPGSPQRMRKFIP